MREEFYFCQAYKSLMVTKYLHGPPFSSKTQIPHKARTANDAINLPALFNFPFYKEHKK
jgi:hypothetical protein